MTHSIVHRARDPGDYPLLAAVYGRHDALISEWLPRSGRVLEVACGRHSHPQADVTVDAAPSNRPAIAGDATRLPFGDDTFSAVVGRRFVHHIAPEEQPALVDELARVTEPGGRLVVLEGTPGLYRRVVKGLAYRLGLLGEDLDEWGHLTPTSLQWLLAGSARLEHVQRLGSPVVPLAVCRGSWSEWVVQAIEKTQWVTWWTFVVGEVPAVSDAGGTPQRASQTV